MNKNTPHPFYTLRDPFSEAETPEEFWKKIKGNDRIIDLLYRPDELEGGRKDWRSHLIKGTDFENVSFSHTTISEITFRNCSFENCLFIGTTFKKLEFHNCSFTNCYMLKCRFEDTYISVSAFDACLDKNKHANIGVHLYQQLMRNFKTIDQPHMYEDARFLFLQWERYELNFKLAKPSIPGGEKWPMLRKKIFNCLYEKVLGYGIRLKNLAWSTIVMTVAFWISNYLLWDTLRLSVSCDVCSEKSIWTALYYTIISLSNLGYGDFVPITVGGRLFASLQAVVGVLWFAVVASMIFRKIAR